MAAGQDRFARPQHCVRAPVMLGVVLRALRPLVLVEEPPDLALRDQHATRWLHCPDPTFLDHFVEPAACHVQYCRRLVCS